MKSINDSTPKSIDTLVEDIHGLFHKDFIPSPESLQTFGQRLASHLSSRIGERRNSAPTLRFSNLGTNCNRKLWYSVNSHESAEELRPEARLKFLLGDLIEELLLFLAEQAGHKVENQQEEVQIGGVKGHLDATIDDVVVDCKSASSLSFKKFAEHRLSDDDPFGYITQLQSYRFAKGLPLAAFLVMDKTLGKITLDKHGNDGVPYDQVVREKKELVAQPEPPERPYEPKPDGKSGNMKLRTVCSYCPFKYTCWSHTNNGKGIRTFLYSSGPRYLTEVLREPDVVEIDINNNLIPREILNDP